MPSTRRLPTLAPLLLTLVGAPVLAQDVDPATLYEVTTEGTSTQVKAGGQGTPCSPSSRSPAPTSPTRPR